MPLDTPNRDIMSGHINNPPMGRARKVDRKAIKYRQEVGQRLRTAREKSKFEPEDVANILHLKPNTYLRYERGERLFPMYLIRDFSRFTGYSVIYLVTGEAMDFGWPLGNEAQVGVETDSFAKLPPP